MTNGMIAGPPHKRKLLICKSLDLTDDVRAHVYRQASSGQVRPFGSEVAPPESGPQHIDVVHGRRNHERPGARPKERARTRNYHPEGGVAVGSVGVDRLLR